MAGAGGQEVGRISIRVVPNTDRFRQQLKAQLEAIEKTMKAQVPVEANLDSRGAMAQFRAMMAALRAQAARGVDVKANVQQGQIDKIRQFTNTIRDFGDSGGYAGRTFLGLTRIGWIVAAVFAAAAPAIGLVAGLLAGLPSLVSAFGAGAGAIALGLDGIKAAAEKVTPQLDALKTSVSSVFEERMTPAFEKLGGVLQAIEPGMRAIAGGLSDMMDGFVGVVSQGRGLEQLQTILSNTAGFFSGLKPMVEGFTQTFLTLSEAGSNAFGYLQDSLNRFATGFNEMVNRVTSTGVFDSAMKGLSQTLDGVLNLFTRLMESGLESMGQLGQPLQNLFNGLGDALIAMMPGLTAFSSLLGNVIGALGSALAPAITAVTPALVEFANTFGTLLSANLTALSPVLTQVASALGTTLLTALQQITPMMPQLIQTFSMFATTLATSLAPILPQLAQGFGTLLGQVIALAPSFLNLLTTAIIPMIPQFMQLAQQAMPLAEALIRLAPAGIQVANAFLQMAAPVAGLVGTIAGLAAKFMGLISPITAVATNFDTLKNKVIEFGTTVATKAGEVVNEITALPGKIQSAAGNFGSVLVSAGKALMDGLLSGIKAGFGAVADFVSGIAGKIAALKGPLPYDKTVLVPNGEALMFGLKEGIESGASDIYTLVKTIATAIAEAFKDVFGTVGGMTLTPNLAPMQTQMQGIASSAQDFSSAMTSGLPSLQKGGKIDSETRAQLDQLQIEKDKLELQRQQLQAQKNQTSDKGQRSALQQQIDQLNIQKQQLSLQHSQLEMQAKYSGEVGTTTENYNDLMKKTANMPLDFAKANASQFASDLGIGGQGALSQALQQGLQFGEQFVFNVLSMDDALSGQQRIQNKKSLQFTQR